MPKKQKPYTRLRGRGLVGSNSLYLGSDHLLSINTTFFSEDYMRFYYRDIQALITRKTSTGKILNLVFTILLIIFLIPALRLEGGLSGFFFTLTVPFFILIIINWLKGPTSVCHIVTPIQTVKLPALRRIKITKKAINQLRPYIENIQGILTQESLQGINQEEDLKSNLKKTFRPLKYEKGTFHFLLFSFLLANVIFISIDIFYQNMALTFISTIIMLATIVFLIIALIKQTGSALYNALKIITWSTTGYICIYYIFSIIISFYIVLKNPGVSNNQWELIKKASALSPMEYPWLMGFSVFSLCISLIIGISGLVLIGKFRKEYNTSQDIPKSSNDGSLYIELDYE